VMDAKLQAYLPIEFHCSANYGFCFIISADNKLLCFRKVSCINLMNQ